MTILTNSAFNPATTPSLLRHVRDCVKGSPRSLYANIIMTAGPIGTPAIVAIQLCFSGPRSEGEAYVQAIGSWQDDRCLFQDFSERTFQRQQIAVEEVLKDGRGRKWYIKSDMLSSLSDDVIDKTCQRFPGVPDGCSEFSTGPKSDLVADFCSMAVRIHWRRSNQRYQGFLLPFLPSRFGIHGSCLASVVPYRAPTS